MIISVSRRTDIPAFYSEWFFNRIKEGFAYVQNPMNSKQVSKVNLLPNVVDCIVFWTKDAEPMLNRLNELENYKYYFQYTITPYGDDIEKGIPNKNKIIDTFKKLSNKIGKEKVILRYDPILLSNKYTIDFHSWAFEKLLKELSPYTEKCVISFLDLYKKTEKNTRNLGLIPLTIDKMNIIADKLSNIASKYHIVIETCSEDIDFSKYNINRGKCIDDKLISKIIGKDIDVKKDDTQREVCGCVKSIDIGQYNSCRHHCLYCYANFNFEQVKINANLHNPSYPLLIGEVREGAKITNREMKLLSHKENSKQLKLNELF